MEPDDPEAARTSGRWTRLWPLAVVLGALAAAYALGLHRALSFEALGRQQQWLQGMVAAHPVWAPAAFVLVYTAVVAVSIPGSVVLTLAGGLLFGTVGGAVCAVIGATAGAVLLFLAARHAAAGWAAGRGGATMGRLRVGLEQDGFSYLLAIRLVPVVPFWLANLAPALAGMRLAPFAAATGLGIVPATVVFASIGAGLGDVLAQGGRPDLSVIFRPGVLLPLVGLAALSLLPVVMRRWRVGVGAGG